VKKVLLSDDLRQLLTEKSSYLDRSEIKVFSAGTNNEILKIHSKERVDLIVTQLELPGMKTEELFNTIRKSHELREVATILICKDTLAHRDRCRLCKANALFTLPLDIALLHIKMHKFLNVAPRIQYRAPIALAIQGAFKNRPRPFWTENISTSGMLIKAEQELLLGDGIYFSFFLPDGTHISGYGEIARTTQTDPRLDTYLYGVKFTNIGPTDKMAIENALNR